MAKKRKSENWSADPLPRGRHKLSARAVRESQRARIMQSMLSLVARNGYSETSVPDVVAAAHVSRNVFYEFFKDKEECFLSVFEDDGKDIFRRVSAGVFERHWTDAVRTGTRASLQWWHDHPDSARIYFIETPVAGYRAIEQRQRAYHPFEEMFAYLGARARKEQKGLPPLRSFVPRMLIVATTELIADEIRENGVRTLLELEDDIVFLTVKMLADDDTAEATAAPVRLRAVSASS